MKNQGVYFRETFKVIEAKDGELTKIERIDTGEEFVKLEEAADEELQVGDYAKFIEDECEHSAGEVVKIVGIDGADRLECKLEKLDGTPHGYGSERVLVKATPADVIAAHM